MVSTMTIYTCDICGERFFNDKKFKCNVSLPFLIDCDWNEGDTIGDYLTFEKVDICENCLALSTALTCGIGRNNKRFRE